MHIYLEISIPASGKDQQEQILAFIADLPFEAFEETEGALLAYVRKDMWSTEWEKSLVDILQSLNADYSIREVQQENWNTSWESNFEPVHIEPNLCRIYAPFHEKSSSYKYQIMIQPKMAFGTGHHATTKSMIRAMLEYNMTDKSVIDLGTGTGILAILALKRGASSVIATDIDPIAIENAIENEKCNHLNQIKWMTGELKEFQLPTDTFDVIIANIQLNVLKNDAEEIFRITRPMGLVFLSGVLSKDQKELLDAYHQVGFELDRIHEDSGWICAVLRRFSR
jgi:ribosomal protein L11 methyltransferase